MRARDSTDRSTVDDDSACVVEGAVTDGATVVVESIEDLSVEVPQAVATRMTIDPTAAAVALLRNIT